MKISKRIETIIELCPSDTVYADVGCDHGYVSTELVKQNKAKKVYACDISEKCLEKTKILAQKENIENQMEFVCCDGLTSLQNLPVSACVIAGIGGREIISILKNSKHIETLVLQPMRNVKELREFLVDHNHKILKDFVISEKSKFYHFILAFSGQDKLTNSEIMFGRTNLESKTEDFKAFIMSEIDKTEKILLKNSTQSAECYLQNLKNILKYLYNI